MSEVIRELMRPGLRVMRGMREEKRGAFLDELRTDKPDYYTVAKEYFEGKWE